MRPNIISLICAFFLFGVAGNSQQALPRDAADFYNKVIFTMNPKHTLLLSQITFSSRYYNVDEKNIRESVQPHADKNKLGNMEVEALVMLAMIESVNNNARDIGRLMCEIECINNAKQQLYEAQKPIGQNKSMSTRKFDSLKLLIDPNYKSFTYIVVKGSTVTKGYPPANSTISLEEIHQLQSNIQERLAAINELDEPKKQQLQKEIDKRTIMLETISNLMKKIKDTQDSIIQHLK